jgi:hypothetical protein
MYLYIYIAIDIDNILDCFLVSFSVVYFFEMLFIAEIVFSILSTMFNFLDQTVTSIDMDRIRRVCEGAIRKPREGCQLVPTLGLLILLEKLRFFC